MNNADSTWLEPTSALSLDQLGVVERVTLALRPENRLAAFLGALGGGWVPFAVYIVAHSQVAWDAPLLPQKGAWFVAGGLAYSATTVYQWARLAFGGRFKAVGFVLLTEGVMVASDTPWLAIVALAYLVGINAVATGCQLALDQRQNAREGEREAARVRLEASQRATELAVLVAEREASELERRRLAAERKRAPKSVKRRRRTRSGTSLRAIPA